MRAISYPFRITSNGKVEATEDFSKIQLDRALTLISTILSQRMMRPNYGVNVKKGLYENLEVFEVAMEQAIREAMLNWLPNIEILSYKTSDLNDQGVSEITILLGLPNGVESELSVRAVEISPEGFANYVPGS